jgi:hypothetical protein
VPSHFPFLLPPDAGERLSLCKKVDVNIKTLFKNRGWEGKDGVKRAIKPVSTYAEKLAPTTFKQVRRKIMELVKRGDFFV